MKKCVRNKRNNQAKRNPKGLQNTNETIQWKRIAKVHKILTKDSLFILKKIK